MKHWYMIVGMYCVGITQLFAGGIAEGTLVKVSGGYKRIETLAAGDSVLACNTQGHCTEEVVLAVRTKKASCLTQLRIENEELLVDPTHRFFLAHESSWVAAKQLELGQEISSMHRQKSLVRERNPMQTEREITLIDISVAEHHNFYITQRDVLVHNFGFVISIPLAAGAFSLEGILAASATATAAMNARAAVQWLERKLNHRQEEDRQAEERRKKEARQAQIARTIRSVVRGDTSWETLHQQDVASNGAVATTLEDLEQGCRSYLHNPQQLQAWARWITEHEHLVSVRSITRHPQGEAIIEVLNQAAEGVFSTATPEWEARVASTRSGGYLLHIAVKMNNERAVRKLLERGARVNTQTSTGETALFFAASNGDANIVNILLEQGAQANMTNNKGKSPLHAAVDSRDPATIMALLEGGANVEESACIIS